MTPEEAEEYLVPFAHVLEYMKPKREENRREARRRNWWIHGESRPAMRRALEPLEHFIVILCVTKHLVCVCLAVEDRSPDAVRSQSLNGGIKPALTTIYNDLTKLGRREHQRTRSIRCCCYKRLDAAVAVAYDWA